MPKVFIDPVKATEQFKADLAFMAQGQAKPEGGVQQRMLAKNFSLNVGGLKFNLWAGELSETQTIEDALDPAFWAGQVDDIIRTAHKGLGDIIEIRKPSASSYAKLLVVEIGKGYVRTVKIEEAKVPDVVVPEASALTTRWNAQSKTHEVIRAADKVVMQQDFQTKAAAVAWITDHLAKVAP